MNRTLTATAEPRREKYPGRKPVPDRSALIGILFVLRTGLRWLDLRTEMGCGSGVTWGADCATSGKAIYSTFLKPPLTQQLVD